MGKKIVFILLGEIKYDGRVQKEIRSLQKYGNEVELIVSRFDNDDYSNYNFKIHVIPSKEYGHAIQNFVEKFFQCRRSYQKLEQIQPDIVHCNDLNTLYAGYLFKKKYPQKKLVYDSHELFPEIKRSRILRAAWNWIEKELIPYADEIIMPEPNRAAYFEKKYGLKKPLKIIENYPVENTQALNTNYLDSMFPDATGRKKVLYIGSILPCRHLEAMIAAACSFPEDFCLCIVGFAPENYLQELKQLAVQSDCDGKVFFGGPVPNSAVIDYIRSADLGLIFYQNNNLNNYYCASNKLYEFINSGVPVVTNDYPGLVGVVVENQVGVCIDAVSQENINQAVAECSHLNISNALVSRFTWENVEEKLAAIYQ